MELSHFYQLLKVINDIRSVSALVCDDDGGFLPAITSVLKILGMWLYSYLVLLYAASVI